MLGSTLSVAVGVIPNLFDVFQPIAHFIIAVSLSYGTQRPGIKASVSFKERTRLRIANLARSHRGAETSRVERVIVGHSLFNGRLCHTFFE